MVTTLLAALVLSQGKLGIKDVVAGKGQAAQPFDVVTVDYTGTLTDGTKFDSSVGKQPFTFLLGGGQVIKGWDQGIVGMKVGGRRLLTIPPSLGYGPVANGPIPANATLKFDVTLHKIERAKVTTEKAGSGPGAKPGDVVEVHYTGTLEDGKKFDSSHDHKPPEPLMIAVGRTGLIPGFTQALIGIRKGEVRKVVIPPSLGYGSAGRPPVIPANSTLIFTIEAVSVRPEK